MKHLPIIISLACVVLSSCSKSSSDSTEGSAAKVADPAAAPTAPTAAPIATGHAALDKAITGIAACEDPEDCEAAEDAMDANWNDVSSDQWVKALAPGRPVAVTLGVMGAYSMVDEKTLEPALVDAFKALIKADDPRLVEASLSELSESDGALDITLPLLDHASPAVQATAISSLITHREDPKVKAVVGKLKELLPGLNGQINSRGLVEALLIISTVEGEASVPHLIEWIDKNDNFVLRSRMVGYLGKYKANKDAAAKLKELTSDKEEAVAEAAANALK